MEVRLLAVLVIVTACYAPAPVPGAPCGADGACPAGLTCSAQRTCEPPGTDAATSDAPADAADAAPIDAVPDAPPNAPQLVQQATQFVTPGTQVTATFPDPPVAGRVLIAIAACPSGALDSITGAAPTWTRATGSTANANVELWYAIADGSSKTVTAARATCGGQISLAVSEWTNVATASLLDVSETQQGSASPATAGGITTTPGTRLVVFAVANSTPNVFGSPSDGPWNDLAPIDDALTIHAWWRVVGAPATIAPVVSETGHNWDAVLVALRGASN